jgi:hypothetical protein
METLGLYAKEFKLEPDVRLSAFNNVCVSVWQGADGWFMSVSVHSNKIVEADRIGRVTVNKAGCLLITSQSKYCPDADSLTIQARIS